MPFSLTRNLLTFVREEHLAADHNSFASTLPIDWSAASKLTSVFLNSNYLFSSIPASWGTLSQLEELWISNNVSRQVGAVVGSADCYRLSKILTLR